MPEVIGREFVGLKESECEKGWSEREGGGEREGNCVKSKLR